MNSDFPEQTLPETETDTEPQPENPLSTSESSSSDVIINENDEDPLAYYNKHQPSSDISQISRRSTFLWHSVIEAWEREGEARLSKLRWAGSNTEEKGEENVMMEDNMVLSEDNDEPMKN